MSSITTPKPIAKIRKEALRPVGADWCVAPSSEVTDASAGGVSPGGTPVPGSRPVVRSGLGAVDGSGTVTRPRVRAGVTARRTTTSSGGPGSAAVQPQQ